MKRLKDKDDYHTGDRVRLVGTSTEGAIDGVRRYQGYPEYRVSCGHVGHIGWFEAEHLEPASPPTLNNPELIAEGVALLGKRT